MEENKKLREEIEKLKEQVTPIDISDKLTIASGWTAIELYAKKTGDEVCIMGYFGAETSKTGNIEVFRVTSDITPINDHTACSVSADAGTSYITASGQIQGGALRVATLSGSLKYVSINVCYVVATPQS